jgi:DNA invertase Pin-like site-specific DNA recombinase
VKYGYGRISTNDGRQTTAKWDQVLADAGVESANIVYEEISGAKSWKGRKLGELVERLQRGDEIITPELSRLGRSASDVLSLRDVLNDRGITAYTLKEGYRIGADMRPADKMVVTVMAAAAEMERDYISMRIKEGIAHSRATNPDKPWGRRKGQTKTGGRTTPRDLRTTALRMLANNGTVSSTARELGVTRQTIYNWKYRSD